MLCNVLICVLTAYVMISPYFYVKAVKFGIRLAEEPEEVSKETESTTFNLPKKKVKPKMTPEEDRTYQILANIDRYDGTSRGQEEVKVDGK